MKEKLVKIFARHCDLDRAARNYKIYSVLGSVAWGSRTLMQGYAAYDLLTTVRQQPHDFSITDLFNGSELSLKFATYSFAWAVLKGVHWGSYTYAMVGLARKNDMV
jgi:hypothetical protein